MNFLDTRKNGEHMTKKKNFRIVSISNILKHFWLAAAFNMTCCCFFFNKEHGMGLQKYTFASFSDSFRHGPETRKLFAL